MKKIGFTWILLLFLLSGKGQLYTLHGGFQVKPIFGSDFLRTGALTDSVNLSRFTITQSPGFTFGGILRNQFKKNLSFEYGASITQRNYQLYIADSQAAHQSKFRMNCFEIPLLLQSSIPINKTNSLSGSFGLNINVTNRDYFFPTLDSSLTQSYYKNFLSRRFTLLPGAMANLGWEKSLKDGQSIYLGIAASIPVTWMYRAYITHQEEIPPFTTKAEKNFDLRGNYLTIDLRYYLIKDRTDLVYKPGGYGEY